MNWLTKAINFKEKIKKVLRKRPSKEDIANSDWTSCCKGPILKKDLENNLWVCNLCGKHHRISCRQRFDIVFGKNAYQILESPIPTEDPLNWVDTKSPAKCTDCCWVNCCFSRTFGANADGLAFRNPHVHVVRAEIFVGAADSHSFHWCGCRRNARLAD